MSTSITDQRRAWPSRRSRGSQPVRETPGTPAWPPPRTPGTAPHRRPGRVPPYQVDARQGGSAVDVTQLNVRVRTQQLRRVTRSAEDVRQGHRETAGVCCCDQLLWIRPFALAEPGVVGIGTLKDAVTDSDRSRTALHVPVPLGGAASDRHSCLLCLPRTARLCPGSWRRGIRNVTALALAPDLDRPGSALVHQREESHRPLRKIKFFYPNGLWWHVPGNL